MDKVNSLEIESSFKKEIDDMINERLDLILTDHQMLSLYKRFGGGIFRRSSIFHGLSKILEGIKGDVCLEIGTFHGITAVVLSRHFKKVISMDILDSEFKYEVIDFLNIKNVEFININDNEEKERLVKDINFDFCYMDGDHTNDTQSDWDLVKHCGRVLFHEYWPEQPSVYELVNSLKNVKVNNCLALWG